jgi:hypothetical protein
VFIRENMFTPLEYEPTLVPADDCPTLRMDRGLPPRHYTFPQLPCLIMRLFNDPDYAV